MRKLFILSLLLMPFLVKAQRQTEYNRRGDEAMERKDYRIAILWYEEGIADCDRYSIDQLTTIWKSDSTMHLSMRVVMGRCLNCLNDHITNNKDTLAIKKIIDYYSEGIGTAKNEVAANYWKEQLEQLRNPNTFSPAPKEPKERMKFFVGYHASLLVPYGIQLGGISKTVGWYVRFHSNFSFKETQYDCKVVNFNGENQLAINEFDEEKAYYGVTGKTIETYLMGSAGILFKAAPDFYISVGGGYWDRQYAREFVKRNEKGADKPGTTGWARDTNSSMTGVAIDLNGMYVIAGKFYATAGGSMMNFKYVYPNLGVGIIF